MLITLPNGDSVDPTTVKRIYKSGGEIPEVIVATVVGDASHITVLSHATWEDAQKGINDLTEQVNSILATRAAFNFKNHGIV